MAAFGKQMEEHGYPEKQLRMDIRGFFRIYNLLDVADPGGEADEGGTAHLNSNLPAHGNDEATQKKWEQAMQVCNTHAFPDSLLFAYGDRALWLYWNVVMYEYGCMTVIVG